VLEWLKSVLVECYPRVHIFQNSEPAIMRIRQYLARAEVPLVLIGEGAPADPLSGARDSRQLVRRLQSRVPKMRVLTLAEEDPDRPGPGSAGRGGPTVPKPSLGDLAGLRVRANGERFLAKLREALGEALRQDRGSTTAQGLQAGPAEGAQAGSADGEEAGQVALLREVSARIRDPSSQGELISEVLRFATRHFQRVAIFMIRDDRAVGLAQVGLARAGGPEDPGLRRVEVAREESSWFRRVFEARGPVRGAPSTDGDRRLAALLGDEIPDEVFVAPLESGGEVVALLYGDNLPENDPIGDTSALEVVLHQAGLALDRAVLERALSESDA
jgi:hypothetical protein